MPLARPRTRRSMRTWPDNSRTIYNAPSGSRSVRPASRTSCDRLCQPLSRTFGVLPEHDQARPVRMWPEIGDLIVGVSIDLPRSPSATAVQRRLSRIRRDTDDQPDAGGGRAHEPGQHTHQAPVDGDNRARSCGELQLPLQLLLQPRSEDRPTREPGVDPGPGLRSHCDGVERADVLSLVHQPLVSRVPLASVPFHRVREPVVRGSIVKRQSSSLALVPAGDRHLGGVYLSFSTQPDNKKRKGRSVRVHSGDHCGHQEDGLRTPVHTFTCTSKRSVL